jgi:hypothetical protein
VIGLILIYMAANITMISVQKRRNTLMKLVIPLVLKSDLKRPINPAHGKYRNDFRRDNPMKSLFSKKTANNTAVPTKQSRTPEIQAKGRKKRLIIQITANNQEKP